MRTEHPSQRWLKQFDAAFIKNGGHNGPATLNVHRTQYAIPLYHKGATPAAAGLAAATAYHLYRKAEDLQEQVEGILHDVRNGQIPAELQHHRGSSNGK